ncbi:MAG: hypothetical protein WBG30_04900 [Psychrilyobacter sp.]|uniref:hypothetical protein n=1 Tax=Psychrilyobacter sp. TaxID=2586924 RepID=UPI003C758E04
MVQNSLNVADYVSIVKDGMNIVFFLVVGGITILTYIKAKTTILQPIKTEIFKIQLKNFSEIMELFNGKSEMEIRKFFCISDILEINAIKLLDNYASLFFELEINSDERPYNTNDCSISIVSKEFMEEHFILDNDHTRESSVKKNDFSYPDAMTRAAIWNNYKLGILSIPNEHTKAQKKIETIMKSPLLPKECLKLLKELLEIVNDNVKLVEEVLNEIVCEIPEKYPNIEELKKYHSNWISNKYNNKIKSFDKVTEKLTDYLREYLLVDSLKE